MANDIGGVWRTIGGRRVFIKEGQSLADAMKKSGKFNNKKNNSRTQYYNDIQNAKTEDDLQRILAEHDSVRTNTREESKLFMKEWSERAKEIRSNVDEELKKDNYESKVYGSDVKKADEQMKKVFGDNFKYAEEIAKDKKLLAQIQEETDSMAYKELLGEYNAGKVTTADLEDTLKTLKKFNNDTDDYEYNLYKQAKENPDSINPMTEWSTDWEDLDKKFKDRYAKENSKYKYSVDGQKITEAEFKAEYDKQKKLGNIDKDMTYDDYKQGIVDDRNSNVRSLKNDLTADERLQYLKEHNKFAKENQKSNLMTTKNYDKQSLSLSNGHGISESISNLAYNEEGGKRETEQYINNLIKANNSSPEAIAKALNKDKRVFNSNWEVKKVEDNVEKKDYNVWTNKTTTEKYDKQYTLESTDKLGNKQILKVFAGNSNELMTAEQLKGKDREEQKEINKQYLKEQNKLAQEKNDANFAKEWYEGTKKTENMAKDNLERAKRNGASVEELSNRTRQVHELELETQKAQEHSNKMKAKTNASNVNKTANYSQKELNDVYKKEDYTEVISNLKQSEINKMNEATFDMNTTTPGTPGYNNAKEFIQKMENKAAAQFLDKQNKGNSGNDVMNDNIRNAYKEYKKKHPGSKINFSKFKDNYKS